MAHPIQRARQALRNAEAQTEQVDGNQAEEDIEAGLGELLAWLPLRCFASIWLH